ncbi:MAG: glycosyltransferase family 39 protein [Candidatus Omnitrophica bacterium]|nr:glycosyltransferase family 39 protein [Candidatus Omnitrophota bacterium]
MISLAYLIFSLLVCLALGQLSVKILRPKDMRLGEEFVFSLGLGLGLLSYTVLIVGLCGILYKNVFLLFGCGVIAVSLPFTVSLLKRAYGAILSVRPVFSFYNIALFLLFGIAFFCILSGALAPETKIDSLCYHLHCPKVFVKYHRVFAIPYEPNAAFPFLAEMLYTLGLLFKGQIVAKLFSLFTGLVLSLAVYVFAKRHMNLSKFFIAPVLCFMTPLVFNELATTYIEPLLSLFTFLAFFSLYNWLVGDKKRWLVLGGMSAGFMLSTKFLGLYALPGLFCILVLGHFKKRLAFRDFIASCVLFSLPLVLFSFIWYLRSFLIWGNPVYPYFNTLFGMPQAAAPLADVVGMGKGIKALTLLAWNITMYPQNFEGYGVQLGGLFLAFIPLLIFIRDRGRALGWIGFFSLLYALIWFSTAQNLRFFMPLVPFLSLAVAKAEDSAGEWKMGRIFKILFVVFLIINCSLAVYHNRRNFKVSWGVEAEEQFLLKNERTFTIADFINKNLPPEAKILYAGDVKSFYINRDIIREDMFALKTKYFKEYKTPAEVFAFLKGQGISHILFCVTAETADENLSEPLRMSALLQGKKAVSVFLKPLTSVSFESGEDGKVIYRLYSIKNSN